MNITPESIKGNPENSHLLTLHYNEMIPFVIEHLKKRTLPVFIALLVLICMIIPLIVIRVNIAGTYPLSNIVLHSLTGLVILPLLLILPHEFLHILPYRLSGARDIRIGANWKEAYFYVTAHNHPVQRGWFMVIALTPAITITAIIALAMVYVTPLWQWSLICALFAHSTMCAGDLALLNYFYINRHKNIVTWDDVGKGEAYFYEISDTTMI
ncbi:MAG: DUF3267 domain-containing protein [Bacteroidales bacterium]|nr:DUF3267 domain-containing protein [Bacteroidales bacterium]